VERAWGATLFTPAARRDTCLAVRVPKGSYRDLLPEDLPRIQQAVLPLLGQPAAQRTAMCYLVADNDYRRCNPDEFARLLRGESALKPMKLSNYAVAGEGRAARASASLAGLSGSPFGMLVSNTLSTDQKMEQSKRQRQPAAPATSPASPAPAPATAVAAPAPAAPLVQYAAPPAPAAPAPAAPTGLLSLLTPPPAAAPPAAPPAPAVAAVAPLAPEAAPALAAPAPVAFPPAPAPSGPEASEALLALSTGLQAAGYEVLTDVAALGIALAAHQPGGKRLIVRYVQAADPGAVEAAHQAAQELQADACLLVADDIAVGTWLYAAGTKVEVVPSSALARWAL
jgi:hypothetical protein